MINGKPAEARVDHRVVAELVAPNARVLDIGCSEGDLLKLLEETKNVDGRGIELSQAGVNTCVARGLSVIQGDADRDLVNYPDDSFDYVILSQTVQATVAPKDVVEHMLRIGRRAIVSIPNFGHWKIRSQIFFRGRMPVTGNLPYSWYDTPNIHFCTIKDFVGLVNEIDARLEKSEAVNASGQRMTVSAPWWFWNLFAEQAVFLLRR